VSTERTDDDAPAAAAQQAAPVARRRRAQNVFIVAFLGYQLLAPLGYYLGERGYDERFSWRMFSNLRMHDCALVLHDVVGSGATAAERKVDAQHELHVAWFNILNRFRTAAVEKFLRSRCERDGVTAARLVRRCRDTDGAALPEQHAELDCDSGAFSREVPVP
jgi:hypothetical protein